MYIYIYIYTYYIYIYIHTYIHIIYIYICIEREREINIISLGDLEQEHRHAAVGQRQPRAAALVVVLALAVRLDVGQGVVLGALAHRDPALALRVLVRRLVRCAGAVALLGGLRRTPLALSLSAQGVGGDRGHGRLLPLVPVSPMLPPHGLGHPVGDAQARLHQHRQGAEAPGGAHGRHEHDDLQQPRVVGHRVDQRQEAQLLVDGREPCREPGQHEEEVRVDDRVAEAPPVGNSQRGV